ncbi:MAG TPA: squalene synthase HpnC [Candidatus Kapabacteria bacterium]|nr:squalene synthase HpnC [Candidatus Kapabacteria bacterium]
MTTQEAFAYCKDLAKHYENFPVGSLIFPARLRDHFFSIYAFSRGADDIADEGNISSEERLRKLDEWDALLIEACDNGTSSHPVFIALAQTIRQFSLKKEIFQRLLSAFRQDVTVKRYETFGDVLNYCESSANPVGELVLSLFNQCNAETLPNSDKICTALQLANFWQDVAVDHEKGRIYLPVEDLTRFNVPEEDIAGKRFTPAFRDLLAFEVDRTSRLFQEGEKLIPMLKGRLKTEIQWVVNDGKSVLKKITSNDFDVLRKSNRLTAADHIFNLAKALLA